MIGTNRTNFSNNKLITKRQVISLRKVFENCLYKFIKLSKTQVFKIMQLCVFIGRNFGLLMKLGPTLMKNALTLLTKSVLEPLRLTAAADAEIHKKVLESRAATLIISNEEMRHFMKVIKPLKDFVLLVKGVTQITQNETK